MKITGGGYGHGIGMSQNAVSAMTAAGMGYTQVLEFFYPGTQVMNVGAGGLISSRGA
jgi:stage II sporulation protein D